MNILIFTMMYFFLSTITFKLLKIMLQFFISEAVLGSEMVLKNTFIVKGKKCLKTSVYIIK